MSQYFVDDESSGDELVSTQSTLPLDVEAEQPPRPKTPRGGRPAATPTPTVAGLRRRAVPGAPVKAAAAKAPVSPPNRVSFMDVCPESGPISRPPRSRAEILAEIEDMKATLVRAMNQAEAEAPPPPPPPPPPTPAGPAGVVAPSVQCGVTEIERERMGMRALIREERALLAERKKAVDKAEAQRKLHERALAKIDNELAELGEEMAAQLAEHRHAKTQLKRARTVVEEDE